MLKSCELSSQEWKVEQEPGKVSRCNRFHGIHISWYLKSWFGSAWCNSVFYLFSNLFMCKVVKKPRRLLLVDPLYGLGRSLGIQAAVQGGKSYKASKCMPILLYIVHLLDTPIHYTRHPFSIHRRREKTATALLLMQPAVQQHLHSPRQPASKLLSVWQHCRLKQIKEGKTSQSNAAREGI